MKEWQRWEAMAEDFASVGDHRREAECLEMALEILPPGHHDVKTRMREHLEAALTRARMRDRIARRYRGQRVRVLAPAILGRKGSMKTVTKFHFNVYVMLHKESDLNA